MSAKLYFSNSPGVLLDRLSQNLEWTDPFQSPHIATPTPAMKRWVQMRLAEKRGIVANARFLPLERTLWQRLEELDRERVVSFRKPARLLDEQGLQLLILGLLRMRPPVEVGAYLGNAGAEPRSQVLFSRRVCQLSQKLAGFFREYEYSRVQEHGRQGLAYLWKHGDDCFQAYLDKQTPKHVRKQVEKLERWQKALYHELFRPGGLRDALGERLGQYEYTLPQYAEMVLAQDRPPADPREEPPGYHLFGLSQISPFHRSLICRLADRESLAGNQARFFIYSLNPCAEYWEDALTPREKRRLQQEDLFRRQKYLSWRQLDEGEKRRLQLETEAIQAEELHLEEEENPLLSQWGKPGREAIQLWSQIPDYDFFGHFQESTGKGLLAAVQDALLKRRGALPEEDRVAQDDTLEILACPEIHREAETVHQSIVANLLADPGLRPDEIAVLLPDMERYRHVLAAVFGRVAEGEPGFVPYTLADTSASGESEYARAVAGLFELARGRFTRKEVLALAGNPCFRQRVGLDEPSLKAWSRWTGKLNIFHCFDEEDKRLRGYSPESSHTWSHGLRRLVLGTVMETPLADDGRSFAGVVPYADGDSPDRDLLQGFLLVVEALYRDLAPLRTGGSKPWATWIDLLGGLFDRYLAPPEEEPLEAFVQVELRRYLHELLRMDPMEDLLGGEGRPGPPQGQSQPLPGASSETDGASSETDGASSETDGVPAETPMDLILSRLQGLKAGREPHLSGGVNIAGLAALRSLPFKLTYVLGLGEGEFPEEPGSLSTLDLRQHRRVIGDVDPAARNRYLFLEALVCTTGKLHLSYVCRDLQNGKAFQMCSVLNELADYLKECVLAHPPGKPAGFRYVPVPLLSRSPALFAPSAPGPWEPLANLSREERLLAWLERKRGEFRGGDFKACLKAGLPAGLLREVFMSPPEPAPAGDAPAQPARVFLEDVRRYLENPAQYGVRAYLGIRDNREEDPADLEDEPFFCPFPKDLELLQHVLASALADWETPAREKPRRGFDALYENLSRRGLMPEGHYRDLDRELLWERADAALEALGEVAARLGEDGRKHRCYPGVSFGEGGPWLSAAPVLSLPSVRLSAVGRRGNGEPGGSGDREVELHGFLPCLFRPEAADRAEGGGCAALVFIPGKFNPKRLLTAYLFYLAGVCSDSEVGTWLRAGPFTIHYLYARAGGGKARFEAGNWPPFHVGREEARAYLQALIGDMLSGPDFDQLPFDLIADCLVEKRGSRKGEGRLREGVDCAEILREQLEAAEEDDRSDFKPGESLKILAPKVPADAERKIRERLGPFFNWK